jgi:initiation factor 1A
MVKNQNGGKNSKKMGRKFVTNSSMNKKVRLAEEEGEIYAVVTKLFGNGMFSANDPDGKERLCIMRNKFRGRSKRDNSVCLGTWVLIGEREFESCPKPKHDLLEVYTDIEKQKLKNSGNPVFAQLRSDFDNKNKETIDEEDDDLVFGNGETDKYSELLKTVYANTDEATTSSDDDATDEANKEITITNNNKKKVVEKKSVIMDDGDEIDVDDI